MDLSKILKGHEGEIFWSAIFGHITLKRILKEILVFEVVLPSGQTCEIDYTNTGRYKNSNYLIFQKCTLFPSKENQDWEKWEKEHPTVEPIKVGQYIKTGLSRYQITNITKNKISLCNITTGKELITEKDDIDKNINNKEITLINNIEDILEPFDKVLVQFRENGPWKLDFYSNFDGSNAHCINHCVTKERILPYYPNKHLFNNGEK